MAKDFRANQIRTNAIVGSGSAAWTGQHRELGLLVYSSSQALDYNGGLAGALNTKLNAYVGRDVWMAVDGQKNNSAIDGAQRAPGSSVLFMGDVVVSGTLWAERSVVEVDDGVVGDFRAPNKIIQGFTGDPQTGTALFLADPTATSTGPNGSGAIAFKTVQGTAGDFSISNTDNRDVFFYVSGSRGAKNSTDRGLALFGGDVFVSGNLELHPDSTFTIPGDFTIGGDLQINGNDIKDSSGNPVITMSGDGNNDVTIAGDVQVSGNTIKSSTGAGAISLAGNSINVPGTITLGLNSGVISAENAGELQLTMDAVRLTGDLIIAGDDIKDVNNNAVMHLSGSGDASFNKNVTIVGDLMVSGSTVSIGVENLRVEDPVVLMGSGSVSINSNGGIAIASGSSVVDQALTFGKGNATNSWRAGRKDVNDGNVTTLSDSVPVVIEAAGLSFPAAGSGANLSITGSADGASTHMTMSNDDGDVTLDAAAKINLLNTQGIWLPNSQPVYYGAGGSSVIVGDGGTLQLRHHPNSTIQLGVLGNTQTALEFSPGSGMRLMTTSSASAASEINKMFISGGHYTSLYADAGVVAGSDYYTSTLVLSASSDDLAGGPVIILSSSAEYTGGGGREGFISIGANESTVNELFSMSMYRDVRILLSGSTDTIGTNVRGVTLASGDFVVSGSSNVAGDITAGGDVTIGGTLSAGAIDLQNLELSAANPYVQFNNSTYKIFKDGSNLKFQDDVTGPITLADLNSLSVVDNTNVFTVLEGEPSYVKTSGSFSFDTGILSSGPPRHTTTIGDNAYFFVSGSVGSGNNLSGVGNGERGTAVFGGDVHISGTMWAERPFFPTSLNTAYSVGGFGSKFGSLIPGDGAIINTYSIYPPVQIKGSTNDKVVLGLSGSLDFVTGSTDVGNSRIKMVSSTAALGFHNSSGEVFQLLPGASGTNARFSANNQLQFGDTSRYVYGLTEDTVKKLRLHNNSTGGSIVVSTTSGHMEVTGSVYPGADTTYDLGSPDYRWANVYTGDLHLRNDRGNWTIYEEPDMLVVVNNLTGKKYKMGLTPLGDEE